MSTLTDQELRATLYFAVGVTSESGYTAYKLAVAGDNPRTPMLEVADNSGYTIGTIQTDLGQHYQPNVPNGENVPRDLVNAYQAWATANQPTRVLTPQQVTQTIADLGRMGNDISAHGGRPLDAEVKSRLDAFLATDTGVSWVHGRDVAQIEKLMENAIAPLQRSTLYQTASEDDQVRLAAIVGKVYNQNESRAAPLMRNLERNQYNSLADVSAAIDGLIKKHGDYFEDGRDKALLGADVVNALRNANSESPLARAWRDVLANPLIDPTTLGNDRAHQDLPHQYATVKNLFLHYDRAEGFIGALDRGGTYQNAATDHADPTHFNGAGFYAAGNDLVNWSRDGKGHAFTGGAWSGVERSDLSRARNADGTTDVNLDESGQSRRLLRVDPHAPVLRPPAPSGRAGPNDLAHPDHAMLEQIREGVRKMGADAGVPFDDNAERLCHSLLAACKDNRDQYPGSNYSLAANALTRVDHVVAGPGHVFAVQGRLDDPAQLRAHVPVAQAVQTPIEQSDAKLLAANQAISQEQSMLRQQEMQPVQDRGNAPKMSI